MITSFGEDVELEHLHVAGEIENGAPTVENSLPVPQVVNHRVTIPSSSIYPREENICGLEACTPVLTTVLFIIAKKQEQPKCLLNGLAKRGVSVQWDVLWQLNGVLLPVATRMNLGNIGEAVMEEHIL